MRKTELTKKQQDKFKWLMEADTINENIEISEYGVLIWEDGYWKDGTWEGGYWRHGFWEDGTWEGGIWESGYWESGTWKDGYWKDGIWKDGTWKNGTWEGGKMWSNIKQEYLTVKWNEKEFEDLKNE